MTLRVITLAAIILLSACTTTPEPAPAPDVVVYQPAPAPPPPVPVYIPPVPPPAPAPPPPPPLPDPAELFVLPKLLPLERSELTDNIDGCAKVQKGLLNTEGFMVFTCEKLLSWYDISSHDIAFAEYKKAAEFDDWSYDPSKVNTDTKSTFMKIDNLGCERNLEIMQWTDRSMNETYPKDARDSHRQIIFIQRFYGPACEPYYDVVVDLANGVS